MRFRMAAVFFVAVSAVWPVTIDRIAITVNSDLIKDSDIDRDLLATQLLNGDAPSVTLLNRKKTATHLIDQVFIREEVFQGAYPLATTEEAQAQVDAVVKKRYRSNAEFDAALRRYKLSEADLVAQFQWQLTVLRFIDARFRPAVLITDEQVSKYYQQHLTQLKRQNPKGTEDDLKSDARNILTGEQVNKLLFVWLDQQRHDAKVRYLEESLA